MELLSAEATRKTIKLVCFVWVHDPIEIIGPSWIGHHIGSLELGWKAAVGQVGLNQSHRECCFSRGIKGHQWKAGRVSCHLSEPVKSPLHRRCKPQGVKLSCWLLPVSSEQTGFVGSLSGSGGTRGASCVFHPATANKCKWQQLFWRQTAEWKSWMQPTPLDVSTWSNVAPFSFQCVGKIRWTGIIRCSGGARLKGFGHKGQRMFG